jgi:DNA-binding transcriptional ArsR family regulator
MMECGELNISEISRRSGLSHASAAQHLEFLTRSGLLTEKRFNRIRIFRVDYANPFVDALSRLFSEWKSLNESPIRRRLS